MLRPSRVVAAVAAAGAPERLFLLILIAERSQRFGASFGFFPARVENPGHRRRSEQVARPDEGGIATH